MTNVVTAKANGSVKPTTEEFIQTLGVNLVPAFPSEVNVTAVCVSTDSDQVTLSSCDRGNELYSEFFLNS